MTQKFHSPETRVYCLLILFFLGCSVAGLFCRIPLRSQVDCPLFRKLFSVYFFGNTSLVFRILCQILIFYRAGFLGPLAIIARFAHLIPRGPPAFIGTFCCSARHRAKIILKKSRGNRIRLSEVLSLDIDWNFATILRLIAQGGVWKFANAHSCHFLLWKNLAAGSAILFTDHN